MCGQIAVAVIAQIPLDAAKKVAGGNLIIILSVFCRYYEMDSKL